MGEIGMVLRQVSDWLQQLERLLTAVTAVILGLLALLVGWQVVARYVFSTGIFWAEELSLLAMMWGTMLGAAGCIWTDSHVRLNILIDRVPAGVRVWMLTVMDGIILWFAFWIVKEGILLAQRTMGGLMSALHIPIGITYIILPVAALIMIIFTVVKALERLVTHYTRKGGTR
jgi:TRAP-type C4-dicarboxylate transport system permease small subunit